jgi:acetylornithine deacetylase
MRYFNLAGVPSGCYGVTGANAHAADEWLDLDSLVPTAKVLAGVIMDWCGIST